MSSAAINNLEILLFSVGSVGMLFGWMIFFRMLASVNSVLPPDRHFRVLAFREYIDDVVRVYEECFPESSLSTAWLVLTNISAVLLFAGFILKIRPAK